MNVIRYSSVFNGKSVTHSKKDGARRVATQPEAPMTKPRADGVWLG
jgi:hypothetical protein